MTSKITSGTLGVLFADPKNGKTSLLAGVFPGETTYWFAKDPSSIQLVASAEYGYTPGVYGSDKDFSGGTIRTPKPGEGDITWLTSMLRQLARSGKFGHDKQYRQVVVDDVSHFGLTELDKCLTVGKTYNKDGSENYSKGYQAANTSVVKLLEACHAITALGVQVWFTSHKVKPQQDKKTEEWRQGGPKFCNPAQAQMVAGFFGICAEVVSYEEYPDHNSVRSFRRAIKCDATETELYPYCDRAGACYELTPPNLRAVYIMNGTDPKSLPRLPGCRWQDKLMLKLADKVQKGAKQDAELWKWCTTASTLKSLGKEFSTHAKSVSSKILIRHIRQAYQDGLALGIHRLRNDKISMVVDLSFLS